MRVPALGGAFDWRVSVAELDSPGPFSDFSGYRRMMVLLRGSGVRLTFADGKPVELAAIGDMAEFDGATAVHCELLGGACADLNLIVSKALEGVQAGVLRLAEPRTFCAPAWAGASTAAPVPAGQGQTLLLFAISGAVAVLIGDGEPATLQTGDFAVHTWDLAVSASLGPVTIGPASPGAAVPLVFLATVDNNSSRAVSTTFRG